MLCSRNNEDLENYYVTVKKLNKTVEQKERSLNELEEEIDLIQQKEAQLNKKREEIYQYFVNFCNFFHRTDIEAYEKENRTLLLQMKELTEDLKGLKKRWVNYL